MLMNITATDALIVVDVQNDFCPGGSMGVAEGDKVVPIANHLMTLFDTVVFTQDWHPPGHASFSSSHPGQGPFETIPFPYGPQTLWPDHCVINTPGADFHPDLNQGPAQLIIRKGFRSTIDSYSAFMENDRKTATGLTAWLRDRGVTRVFCLGLAYDFCVRYSAEDAKSEGFEAVIVSDGCRSVDLPGTHDAATAAFAARGIAEVSSHGLAPRRAAL